MRTYILLEYKRDITISKLGDALVNAATRDQHQDIDTILNALEQIDPTKNKQYVEWLAIQYIRNQFRLEDYPRVNDVLTKFEKIKNKLEQRDINQYTFKSLEKVIDKEFNVELTDTVGDSDVPGAKNLYNGPLGRLDVPMTEEAAKILGRGTKWCTAADKNNMFERYNKEGPLYIYGAINQVKNINFILKNSNLSLMTPPGVIYTSVKPRHLWRGYKRVKAL